MGEGEGKREREGGEGKRERGEGEGRREKGEGRGRGEWDKGGKDRCEQVIIQPTIAGQLDHVHAN